MGEGYKKFGPDDLISFFICYDFCSVFQSSFFFKIGKFLPNVEGYSKIGPAEVSCFFTR